ncbi:nodulation protein NodH [Planktomarina temperata]|uniref:nodulation protein NodH n=1 Tax=Planktomarina temperata TaxID=1284658 RepID=UPI0035C7D25C
MTKRFDYFVIFAEMRTGSNFLEENINGLEDVICHGEAFNPSFLGYPEVETLLGETEAQRNENPFALLDKIKTSEDKISGFRYFHNHDVRIFDVILNDPKCAKIILTRNPLDSFISWKIALATGQWKLTNTTHLKTAQVDFHLEQFEDYLTEMQNFQMEVQRSLQVSGQSAFYVRYEDLTDLDVVNGIAHFLGSQSRLDRLSKKLKRQNPRPIVEKVANFEELEAAVSSIDWFDLARTPNFEPKRGAAVPRYVAAPKSPLLFMPISPWPDRQIETWLAALDHTDPKELRRNFGQRPLRRWKNTHPNHRSFTVVHHPVARAYDVFCRHILPIKDDRYTELRRGLRRVHNLPLPEHPDDPPLSTTQLHACFCEFLRFLKFNLAGQTALRVDGAWASQSQIIQGFCKFAPPHMIVRAETLEEDLKLLTQQVGLTWYAPPSAPPLQGPALAEIYDADLETLAREAYAADYTNFGFKPLEI